MAVIKIKKRKDEVKSEVETKPRKIRIKKNAKEETGKSSLKLGLRKADSSEQDQRKDKGSSVKLKLNLKKTDEQVKVPKAPRLRVKPIRVPGEGYDSEASDIEDDPLIEEGIILRVLPDIQAEFVKNSVESGDYSGINIKWKGHGHAIVNINNISYGAVLVNLPTIVETHKSVDRKNLLKTFDISQMLLCIKVIENEEEVFSSNPPDSEDLISKHFEEYQDEINDSKRKILKGHNGGTLTDTESRYLDQIALKPYDYKHGITPALYNARSRRFRRKMGLGEFEYTEQVVERLLKQDDQSEEVTFELVDEEDVIRRSASAVNLGHFTDSAKDPSNVPMYGDEEKDEDDLDLDAAFQSDEEAEAEAGTTTNDLFEETGDDVEQYNGEEDEEDEEEEEEEDEEEDNEDNEDEAGPDQGVVDKEEVNEGRQHNELLKDELHELETTLNQTKQRLEKATNLLLKSRFIESIKKLQKEVDLKRKQLKFSDESLQDDQQISSRLTGEQEDDDDEMNDGDGDGDGDGEGEPDGEGDEEEDDDDLEEGDDEDRAEDRAEHVPEQELDQNDLDMMMLFGGEGDDADGD